MPKKIDGMIGKGMTLGNKAIAVPSPKPKAVTTMKNLSKKLGPAGSYGEAETDGGDFCSESGFWFSPVLLIFQLSYIQIS
ncbi:MAG: hypothetical protein EWV76_15600 [Microcystis novacekii Mn_MB_F_20050700_S1]|uniref:Uncharacterized protein n=1 Tax=Microcystis novacekii Mn_MB_F_20050700_S1D TaxID=2486266 RepID=A0A552J859_9CHRO|nr:MAG: hypothetical protein EWV76_15600 [Microcystis novacekii Mn_MB_F_20050700_S1]TRU91754.1 MAG: hypothetical protein EWV54_03890 [Microcystis novacekii Mn_MB_F_20050700_S1D]